jgi:hypothetical protein
VLTFELTPQTQSCLPEPNLLSGASVPFLRNQAVLLQEKYPMGDQKTIVHAWQRGRRLRLCPSDFQDENAQCTYARVLVIS